MQFSPFKHLTSVLVIILIFPVVFSGFIFFKLFSLHINENKGMASPLSTAIKKDTSAQVLSAQTQSVASASSTALEPQDQTKIYPDYIWLQNTNEKTVYTHVLFAYKWMQSNLPKEALIKLSCLGHYQLLINNQSIYHGPNFAVLPEIYYDSINVKDKIKIGENQIQIICNFINYPVHEYPNYPSLAVLTGGSILDGDRIHFLSDPARWFATGLSDIQNGNQISNTAGYSEIASFPLELNDMTQTSEINLKNYITKPNPLPLLTLIPQTITKISRDVYDLHSFMVGYLQIKVHSDAKCEATITWGGKLDNNGNPIPYFNQEDKIYFLTGNFVWNQFARRAGRYIKIHTENCSEKLIPSFQREIMPFSEPVFINFSSDLDRKIYKMSVNTLLNNVQNHIEDSVEREKAMYIGDSLAVSTCLLAGIGNENFVKQMIKEFAKSQNKEGKIPSMTPSGAWQFIPGYHLQWIIWLDMYLSKTKDAKFAKEMLPVVQKALDWIYSHESSEGFLFNKNNEDWWNFIDWTPINNEYRYSTPLQILYYKALTSSANIFSLAGLDNTNLNNKATSLKLNLQKMAFDQDNKIFVDSFYESGKSTGSLPTNALAGKFNIFESIDKHSEAINHFGSELTTITAYSQAWVVEWLINAGLKNKALDILRNYWGKMIENGLTSVPESLSLSPSFIETEGYSLIPNTTITSSFSHAWGCGPIFLYPKIFD